MILSQHAHNHYHALYPRVLNKNFLLDQFPFFLQNLLIFKRV